MAHALSRRARLPVALLGAAALLSSLTACSDDDSDASTGASGNPSATSGGDHSGGTLTLAYAAGAGCIDPHQLADALTITVGRQFTDSLTFQDPDSGEIVPALAESWDISPDGTSYTFHLRTGATFSDGTPVDAAAVKANIEDLVDLGARSLIGSSYVAGLKSADVVDPKTVTVTFASPSAQFLQATSTATMGLLAASTLSADPDARCAGKLIGSGPFVIDKYVTDQSVALSKRADYDWAPPSIATHTGPAYLDHVTFQVIAEASVRTGALQSDQVQGVENLQPVDQPVLKSAGFNVLARSNPGVVNVLIPNVKRPALSDVNVRKALQIGIDRKAIIDTLWNDNYTAATSVLAHTTPYYTDESSLLAYDPDGAKQLLDDAGWTVGSDGIREKDGQRLTLSVLVAPAEFELLQQQFKAIGVDLQTRGIDPAQYVDFLNKGDYDLAPYNLTRPDPAVLTALFSSTLQNVPHFTTGPLDQQLAQLAQVSDADQRTSIAADIQRAIIADGYALPTTEQSQVYGFSPAVKDIYLEASSRVYLYGTWLDKD